MFGRESILNSSDTPKYAAAITTRPAMGAAATAEIDRVLARAAEHAVKQAAT
jgi:hypothetical protein